MEIRFISIDGTFILPGFYDIEVLWTTMDWVTEPGLPTKQVLNLTVRLHPKAQNAKS